MLSLRLMEDSEYPTATQGTVFSRALTLERKVWLKAPFLLGGNHHCQLESIGCVPPKEAEAYYYW